MNDRPRRMSIELAIGDAFGAAIEIRSPSSFEAVTGSRDGGPGYAFKRRATISLAD